MRSLLLDVSNIPHIRLLVQYQSLRLNVGFNPVKCMHACIYKDFLLSSLVLAKFLSFDAFLLVYKNKFSVDFV